LKPTLELIDLDAPPMSSASASVSEPIPVQTPSQRRWLWPAVAAVGVPAAVALALWAPWRTGPAGQAVRFEIASTDKLTLITGAFPMVSPNGKWVVFPATGTDNVTRMWIRALDSVEVRPLAGTESANNLPPPVFWSPDSRFIAFGSTPGPFAPGQLKKLDIAGGPPQTICDVPAAVPRGAWNRDGVIVFAHNANTSGLMRVSAAGGVATPITALDRSRQENPHRFPEFLPDGRHFLYFRRSTSRPEYTGVYVGSLDAKPEEQSSKPLLLTDRQASYAPSAGGGSGYLLFLRDTTLFTQPFDPKRLELSGEPVPVADQVGSFAPANAGLFSLSETGVLAYRVGVGGSLLQLTWLDPQGKVIGAIGERGAFANPALSPDGARIAVSQLGQNGNSNIWILDTERGTTTRLTFNSGRDDYPVWSPDGKTVAFASNRSGYLDLYQKPADGSGDERLLLKSDEDKRPTSWSHDGRFLLYTNTNPKSQEDLWILPLEGGGAKPFAFLQTEFRERFARFSPDGRWIAYVSNESGSDEIYVRPFSPNASPDSAQGGKWMISRGGGVIPRWRSDGKKLFYLSGGGAQQMEVDVIADKAFQPGTPQRLFPTTGILTTPDGTGDGKRFLYATPEGANAQTPMTIVLNWQAGLKK
jgi:Tol biopolymer transport system component